MNVCGDTLMPACTIFVASFSLVSSGFVAGLNCFSSVNVCSQRYPSFSASTVFLFLVVTFPSFRFTIIPSLVSVLLLWWNP